MCGEDDTAGEEEEGRIMLAEREIEAVGDE